MREFETTMTTAYRRSSLIPLLIWAVAIGCSAEETSTASVPDANAFSTQDADPFGGPTGPEDTEQGPVFVECEEGQACDDEDLCTINDVCIGGVCVGQPIDCGEPGTCSESVCVAGVCQQTVVNGFCFIEDNCWTDGQPNPMEPCRVCAAETTPIAWSDLLDGASCNPENDNLCSTWSCAQGVCVESALTCEEDQNPCTVASCIEGQCSQTVLDDGTPCGGGDGCSAGGTCQAGVCQSGGPSCDDGLNCTVDSCINGQCNHQVSAGFCAIGGLCLASGELNPSSACQRCEPVTNQTAWFNLPNGSACEDGSSCTTGDSCQQGACVPGASPCPDDGNPCSIPTCDDNACGTLPVADGTPCGDDVCTVGALCSGGQCVGGSAPDLDQDGHIDKACGGDDCDDSTSLAHGGLDEICGDAIDNDCDGTTDEASAGCVDTCQTQADCYPERLCGNWYTENINVCSDPCAGDLDCGLDFICTKVPGSAQVGYCQPKLPNGLPHGSPCDSAGTGSECEGGLCLDGVCRAMCMDGNHCPQGQSCSMTGDLTQGLIVGVCLPTGGLMSYPQPCGSGGFGDSTQCASGHCDLTAGLLGQSSPCSPLCSSQSDCAFGQKCGLVFHAAPPFGTGVSNGATLPYSPTHGQYLGVTFDAVTACYTSTLGLSADGTPCNTNNDCMSGHCLQIDQSGGSRCTRMCSLDNDCQAGMVCKLSLVNLISDWLTLEGANAPSGVTYARTCQYP